MLRMTEGRIIDFEVVEVNSELWLLSNVIGPTS